MTQPDEAPPTVSVIVPVSRPDALPGQLRALAAQALEAPWEVILVVAEPASLPPLQPSAPGCDLRVVRCADAIGPGAARNLGARSARAPVLAFTDDDDEVAEGWLRALVDALQHADAAGGASDLRRLNDDRWIAAYGLPPVQSPLAIAWPGVHFAETSNLAVRRSVFDELGGFHAPMRTAEDRDFSARLQEAGRVLAFVPEAVLHRRLRSSTRAIASQAYRWARGDPLLYRRHRVHGMPPSDGLAAWLRLLRDVPHLLSAGRRTSWLRRAAERVGRLSGSVRHRTWYP